MSITPIVIKDSNWCRPAHLVAERGGRARRAKQTLAWALTLAVGAALPPRAGGDANGPAEPAAPDAVRVTVGPEGLVVESPDGAFRMRVAGLLQVDARFYSNDVSRLATDSFLVRSARPILQATVARRFDLLIQPDFGQGQPQVQDAYLDARFTPAVRLRLGKFKAPFGLERLEPEAWILFPERALPNDIVPNRDVGLQLYGEVGGGAVVYQAALTNGVVDGGSVDVATSDSKDASLRAFVQPFRKVGGTLKGLGLGLAATFGRQQGPLLPAYRTPGQVVFFGYAHEASADGRRRRVSPQASFFAGPVGILAEYVRSTQAIRSAAAAADVTSEAWQVAGSWVLTGEAASVGPRTPRRSFDPGRGGWGALELSARIHALRAGGNAFDLGFADPERSARRATAWGVGLNWYLTRNVKYAADFEQTTFEGGAPAGDRPTERVLLFRAQLAF
jgi:phosphate-selective porin OprO and OprP